MEKTFERTLVMVKPDGVLRGLVGEILHRYERAGLKIVGMKMVYADRSQAMDHYPASEEHMKIMGEKSLETYEKYGLDPVAYVGTTDPLEIGKMIREWNADFLSSGPVVAIVLEGNHAIDNVRMITGNTLPTFALPGTIRGDYSVDSPALANSRKRAVKNLIHASGDPEEAEREIKHWFQENELHSYDRADEKAAY
jgi:nucleoside-diphosphate kinase